MTTTKQRIAELERICAESYQVLSILASEAGRADQNGVIKALDNLSGAKLQHGDVLPFMARSDAQRVKYLREAHHADILRSVEEKRAKQLAEMPPAIRKATETLMARLDIDMPEAHKRVQAAMKTIGDRDEHRAKLIAAGKCPECEGEGEQGGQFCGGYWKCETCDGTGKLP